MFEESASIGHILAMPIPIQKKNCRYLPMSINWHIRNKKYLKVKTYFLVLTKIFVDFF